MPPSPTGVADYSAALLAALRTHGDVNVGVEKADVHLYHIGNNPWHAVAYETALRHPGAPCPNELQRAAAVQCEKKSAPRGRAQRF